MSKVLLIVLMFFGLIASCDSAKSEDEPNKNITGRWHNKINPLTFIDFDGTSYREYMGEINSEIKGKTHWRDSLNFDLEVTEVEGIIGNGKIMKPGKYFPMKIIFISATVLKLKMNNEIVIMTRDY